MTDTTLEAVNTAPPQTAEQAAEVQLAIADVVVAIAAAADEGISDFDEEAPWLTKRS